MAFFQRTDGSGVLLLAPGDNVAVAAMELPAGTQRDVGRGVIVEANYLGSAGRKLYNVTNVNRFTGDLLADNRYNGWNPSFSTINMIESSSSSIHHGGTVQVRKLFSAGLTPTRRGRSRSATRCCARPVRVTRRRPRSADR